MKYKKCCVTGHRPGSFPWSYYFDRKSFQNYKLHLIDIINDLIEQGYNYFISGGALGVDLDFADSVCYLKEEYPRIKLEIAVPFRNHNAKWSERDKLCYEGTLDNADEISVLSEQRTRGCMFVRNRYMVDQSDLVLGFWNLETHGGTYYTICYAHKKNIPLIVYPLQDLKNINNKMTPIDLSQFPLS